MKTTLLTIVGVIGLLFAGCKGDQGDPGPAGPQGPAGSVSITEGSVSVAPGLYPSGAWYQATNNPDIFYVTYPDDAVSDATTDIVEVFVTSDQTNWFPLPTSNFYSSGDALNFSYNNGNVTFYYDYTNPPTVQFNFNVVVIPPSVAKKYPNTNWKDYSTVQALLKMQSSNNK